MEINKDFIKSEEGDMEIIDIPSDNIFREQLVNILKDHSTILLLINTKIE